MKLNAYDEQLALDYIIYMMIGSYFEKTQFASPCKEKIMRIRYRLLPVARQYELEEKCERYFEKCIFPKLTEGFFGDFFEGKAKVYWTPSKDGKRTAVVFVRGRRQLWVSSVNGGKRKAPSFKSWTVGMDEEILHCIDK